MDCVELTSQFNSTWFSIDRYPRTYVSELVVYIICMVVTFLSYFLTLFMMQYYKSLHRLAVRSKIVLTLTLIGPVLQFHTGGLSKIYNSQIHCWFQIFAGILIVPLIFFPFIVKLLNFKTQRVFNEAAKEGIKLEMNEENVSIVQSSTGCGRDLFVEIGRSLCICKRNGDYQKQNQKDLIRQLRIIKFITSSAGSTLLFCIIASPFVLGVWISFAFHDPVFFSTCTGCPYSVVHTFLIIIFGFFCTLFGCTLVWNLRNAPDPFGQVQEVKYALLYGCLPGLIGFILNAFAPAEAYVDGWSWNIMVALSLVSVFFVQSGLQVILAFRERLTGSDDEDLTTALVAPEFENQRVSNKRLNVKSRVGLPSLMNKVLEIKELHDAFEKYLTEECAVETLSFLDTVREFQMGYFDRGQQNSTSLARRIVKVYVRNDSTFMINISSKQREVLVSKTNTIGENIPREFFDEAYTEVKKLVTYGPLLRFSQTEEFQKLASAQEWIQNKRELSSPGVGV